MKISFDYLKGNKTVLSSDGKKPWLRLARGFSNSEILLALGRAGYLRGEALKDYLMLTQKNTPDESHQEVA